MLSFPLELFLLKFALFSFLFTLLLSVLLPLTVLGVSLEVWLLFNLWLLKFGLVLEFSLFLLVFTLFLGALLIMLPETIFIVAHGLRWRLLHNRRSLLYWRLWLLELRWKSWRQLASSLSRLLNLGHLRHDLALRHLLMSHAMRSSHVSVASRSQRGMLILWFHIGFLKVATHWLRSPNVPIVIKSGLFVCSLLLQLFLLLFLLFGCLSGAFDLFVAFELF